MRRGDLYRYEPVLARAGQSTTRLIVSADAVNANGELPTVYAMHVVDSDPGSLLAVRIGELGWAFALEIDRPHAAVSSSTWAGQPPTNLSRSTTPSGRSSRCSQPAEGHQGRAVTVSLGGGLVGVPFGEFADHVVD